LAGTTWTDGRSSTPHRGDRIRDCDRPLRHFNAARLVGIIEQLAAAALEMRKQAPLAAVIAQRTLLSIAVNAKRKG